MIEDIKILKEIVVKVLGEELKDVESIVRAGGLTNKSYKVRVEDKDYIIRII